MVNSNIGCFALNIELTVSLLFLSTALFTPPGVSDGLKDMERLPDTAAAAGTTSFCTGGTEGSSCVSMEQHYKYSRHTTAHRISG